MDFFTSPANLIAVRLGPMFPIDYRPVNDRNEMAASADASADATRFLQ